MNLDKLTDTQRTLLIPLLGRARAARDGSTLLHDPLAAEIADRLQPGFMTAISRIHRQSDAVHIARARVLDDLIRTFLATHPRGTIVNLGAGLDTAFFRVDNGELRWIDVDLPDVIELRRALLPSDKRVRAIARSFLDLSWLESLSGSGEGDFILAAGLFIYFDRHTVREFIDRLAEALPGGELAFDYQSKMSRFFGNFGLRRSGMGAARLRWGMNGSAELERWTERAEVVDAFPLFERVDRTALGGDAAARAARTMDRVRAIMVAHLRFRSLSDGGERRSPRVS